MIENFDPNCVCGGTRERPYPDDCERCQFVVALMAAEQARDEAVREVDRLREEIQSLLDWSRRNPISSSRDVVLANIAALLQPKKASK